MRTSETLPPVGDRPQGPLALLQANPSLLPALGAVVILVALGASEAGFYPTNSSRHPGLGWYPAALLLLGLLTAAVFAVRPPLPLPRTVLAALGLLAGFTAWSYVSIAWAEQQGVAWDGANRGALYLLAFALFALWPLTARAGRLLLGAMGLGIAGLGLVELLRADAAAEPILFFIGARFAEPAGYINANVALWTIGLWPCLYLACAREVNPVLRGLALGGAGLLSCLALLGQSRGWVPAVALAALLFVLVMPGRARALAAVGATAAGTFIASGPLLAVHDDFTPATFDGLLAHATRTILLMAACLAAVGALAAIADRRARIAEARSRTVNRAAVVAVAVALLTATGAAAAAGDPVGRLSGSWQTFKAGGDAAGAGQSRFATAGTNRYDFWTVAWSLFRDQPLTGVGSANFQQYYALRGKSTEQPRYPHSVWLGVLSQTGLVGAILLVGALLAAFLAAGARIRRSRPEAASVAGAAVTVCVYWALHASVDWFWAFPALTGFAFAALGLAVAVGRQAPIPEPVGPRRSSGDPGPGRAALRSRAVPAALCAVAAAALWLSLFAPWLAEREVGMAIKTWPASPSAAYERLGRAESLNPLSPRSHLVAATIAVMVEDQARAADELREVLRLEPRTSFALAELAALASERGEQDRALRLLRRAGRLAPNDQVVAQVLDQVRSGRSITIADLNASYLRKARSRVGRD